MYAEICLDENLLFLVDVVHGKNCYAVHSSSS